MNARLARVLLVLALIVAQQTALAHQIWHLASGAQHAAAPGVTGEQSGESRQGRLCDSHAALGTVLGALNGAAALSLAAVLPDTQFLAPCLPAFSIAAPAPASRDPPSRL